MNPNNRRSKFFIYRRVRVRAAYSYLKKIRGRKRRVCIVVPARYLVKRFKKPKHKIAGVARRSVLKKRKPKVVRRKKTQAVRWLGCFEFMDNLKREYNEPEIDPVFHKNIQTDRVSPIDGFVWKHRVPFIKKTGEGHPVYEITPPAHHKGRIRIRSCSVWFLVHNEEKDSYFIWRRNALFPHLVNSYTAALAQVFKVQRAVHDYFSQEKFHDYIELIGFVAFTMYFAGTKMPGSTNA